MSYLALKCVFTWDRIQCLLAEVKAIAQGSLSYGTLVEHVASHEEDECPICQAELDTPIALHCGHTYCESCISVWMERESTCPLCRQVVREDHLDTTQSDGSTTLLPQI